MTKNRQHSSDAHFQEGAESLSLFYFPLKVAIT
jgi:hypothetical protein